MQKPVKTPQVLQLEPVECGAASLGIVLGYFKKFVPLEQLRFHCGVSKHGSRAKNVIQAATHYGLTAKAYKKHEIDALKEMPLPQIVFWNFNHFLVVEGYTDNDVWLNDPMTGRRKVSYQEFNESYTGIVMTFAPSQEFLPSRSTRSTWSLVMSYVATSKSTVALLFWMTLLLIIPGLIIPSLLQIFIDEILIQDFDRWILPLSLCFLLMTFVLYICTALKESLLVTIEKKIITVLGSKFIWRLLRLPMSFFSLRLKGELVSRVMLIARISSALSSQLVLAVFNLVSIVFFAAVMFKYDAELTLVGVAIAGFQFWVFRNSTSFRESDRARYLQELGKLAGHEISGFKGIKSIKSTGRERMFFKQWAGYQSNAINAFQRLSIGTLWLGVLPMLMNNLAMILILTLGGYRVLVGTISAGALIALQALMTQLLSPTQQLILFADRIQMLGADLKRVQEVMDTAPDPLAKSSDTSEHVEIQGRIDLENIQFGYIPLDPPFFDALSLSIPAGASVAIVGRTGSGKSTLSKLISGLYQPRAGTVAVDGKPLADWSPHHIHQAISVVDQDIMLFRGTIKENLSLWDEKVDDLEMMRACKDAVIDREVLQREFGLESMVEEGGRNFSSGEMQRLEVARALLKTPKILILDEATSALDPITEKQILKNLKERACTCIFISHRLSTIRDCDQIFVVSEGQVVEQGTHQELVSREGAYYEMHAMESSVV